MASVKQDVVAKEQPVRAEKEGALAPQTTWTPMFWGDPYGYMRRFGDEMNHLFDAFGFGGRPMFPDFVSLTPRGLEGAGKAVWSPQVEILEREGMLVIRADVPGLTKDDVSVDVDNDILTIKGERRSEKEEKNEKYFRSERTYGAFRRSFRLPEGSDAANAKATFKDGVLEVELPAPHKPEVAAHRVAIEEKKA